jgi:hypothetical protein
MSPNDISCKHIIADKFRKVKYLIAAAAIKNAYKKRRKAGIYGRVLNQIAKCIKISV